MRYALLIVLLNTIPCRAQYIPTPVDSWADVGTELHRIAQRLSQQSLLSGGTTYGNLTSTGTVEADKFKGKATGGTNHFIKQSAAGGLFTSGVIALTELPAGVVLSSGSPAFLASTQTFSGVNTFVSSTVFSGRVDAGTIYGTIGYAVGAGTAGALGANPTDCSANQFANAIAASGNLTCAALVTADLPAGLAYLASSQTWTGANTYNSSSVVNGLWTLNGAGTGIHKSSAATNLAQATGTNTTFGTCIAGSTVTITTTGGSPILASVMATTYNGTATSIVSCTIQQDGAFLTGMTTTKGGPWCTSSAASESNNCSFQMLFPAPSAGSHSYCIACRSNAGTWTFANDANLGNQFWVMEIK